MQANTLFRPCLPPRDYVNYGWMSWQDADPEDYESGKEWEWDATIQSMLTIKNDLEPLPLFSPKGQQVGIGINLYVWNEQGAWYCQWEDESWPCWDTEDEEPSLDEDDDRLFSYCPEDFQRSSVRDDE